MKLENILITNTFQVKLTDFGLSKYVTNDLEMMTTRCGTPNYAAPEIMRCEAYTSAVDLWSLGVVLYLLYVCVSFHCTHPLNRIYCEYPFSGDSLAEVYERIEENQISFPAAAGASESVQDLIKCLLVSDTQQRYTVAQIRAHPWVQKVPMLCCQNLLP